MNDSPQISQTAWARPGISRFAPPARRTHKGDMRDPGLEPQSVEYENTTVTAAATSWVPCSTGIGCTLSAPAPKAARP